MRLFDAILDANHRAVAGDRSGTQGRGLLDEKCAANSYIESGS
jgi:hypothetical protein